MLINFSEHEYHAIIDAARAAAIPGDLPAWANRESHATQDEWLDALADNAAALTIAESEELAEPLPTMADVRLSDPNHVPEKLYRCEVCYTLFTLEEGRLSYDDEGELFVCCNCGTCGGTGEEPKP